MCNITIYIVLVGPVCILSNKQLYIDSNFIIKMCNITIYIVLVGPVCILSNKQLYIDSNFIIKKYIYAFGITFTLTQV